RHGPREAIVFDDARLTFAAVRDRARVFAAGLAALGLGRGDALAIWLPNRPLWFVAQYAAASLGVVVVALNPRYRAHELAYILGQSHAVALLATDRLGPVDYLDTLEALLPELADAVPGELASARFPRLRHVIVDSEAVYPGFDPLRALMLIERERCTVWNAVDSMLIPLLDHPDVGRRDLSSLRTGGVAATGGGRHGLLEEVLERLMPLAFQPYGMTEVNAMSLLHELDEPAADRLLPGVWPAPGLEARVARPETGAI